METLSFDMGIKKTVTTPGIGPSEFNIKNDNPVRIERGMNPEEVSEIISDRIVDLIKRQLEEIQKKDNEK